MPQLKNSASPAGHPEIERTLLWVNEGLKAEGLGLKSQTEVVQLACQVLHILPHLALSLRIPLWQDGDDLWKVVRRWNQLYLLGEQLMRTSLTVGDAMVLEQHGLFKPALQPLHQPLLERYEERTGLTGLALMAKTTHGMHLVFPFGNAAPVVQAEVTLHGADWSCAGHSPAFWEVFKRTSRAVKHLRALHVVDSSLVTVHGREQPGVQHYAAVAHNSQVQIPVYASVTETEHRITFMLVLREVRVRGRHTSAKLAVTCKTRKVLVSFNKESRRMYRMEGKRIWDVSYQDALPEQDTVGPFGAWEVFDGRVRQFLLDGVTHLDTRYLMLRCPLRDVVALATTPAVTHYAHLRLLTAPWGGEWNLEICLPGKWLRPGRRKTGVEFKRWVFPKMDRRVLRQITPQNVGFIHQLALLLGDANLVVKVLEVAGKERQWLHAGVLTQALRRGRVKSRLVSFRKAFMRSVRRQGLEDTLLEVNNMARQLKTVLDKDPAFTLPGEVSCITRLHNLINRQALLTRGRRSSAPFKVLREVKVRLGQQVTVDGVTLDFQVARTEEDLIEVGMDLNICVGGYAPLVRKGGRVVVVGRQEGKAVFCVEVTGNRVLQFKMKHNQVPAGFHLTLARQYLQQVQLRCTTDLFFVPAHEVPFLRLLQGKDIPQQVWPHLQVA